MNSKAESLKAELIDQLVAKVHEQLPPDRAETASNFVQRFYAHVAPQDMLAEEPDDLYGAAVAMWAFGRDRGAGQAKVRAYNPHYHETGWSSSHTVVEIVNDDMPFLVDSVTAALDRMGLTVHLVIHPILAVGRADDGSVQRLDGHRATDDGLVAESFMHLQISEQGSEDALRGIEAEIQSVLTDVRAAVEDWRAMRERMLSTIEEIQGGRGTDDGDPEEIVEFLRWNEVGHFTFLGYRSYTYSGDGAAARMTPDPDTGLGILRDPDAKVFDGLTDIGALPERVRAHLLAPKALAVLKASRKARVHRAVHMDVISVKRIDAGGKVVGEHRFVGLFTSVAYNQSPMDIPFLRQKVSRILEQAEFAPTSHDGKAMVNILETYPRDELFQATEDELFQTAIGILHLQERKKTALFQRPDALQRFVTCIVFVPRDEYNTQLRERISDILARAYDGRVSAFYTQMSDSVLARLHFIIGTTRGSVPDVDVAELEARLVEASRSWSAKLLDSLIDSHGEERGNAILRCYGDAFPTAYREAYPAAAAIHDIERMEDLRSGKSLGMSLFRRVGADDMTLHLKFFHRGRPVPLSDVMPMLEDMGVKVLSEAPYEITPADHDGPVWMHDFEMVLRDGSAADLGAIKDPFQDAFAAVWDGRMEDDGFNVLVLKAGLEWREVTVLRAYAKYLKQAAFTFSQEYMQQTLAANAGIARLLVDLFAARFDPTAETEREKAAASLVSRIEEALDSVANLDEDRILRRYLNLIQSTLRTNYYQLDADGQPKDYVSFKLDSRAIDELPAPRPLVEVWVYSPRVEAVHLRGGKVARGGIRWSDRREDFRAEILGLMKAQMTKNAVIVPVGSKGGFVVKQPPVGGTREEVQAEGIECYKTLMRGLLDLTDNQSSEGIVPPTRVVRHDGDDPYLVVAADKGTATFSDIANGVSQDYGFWLDDAFASGGSAGYDHKKMGITARGAWESVKRHFREIGVDTQTTDFTVVGVGDMSGDVFGNGMLLSKHIKLLGAFNHLHVFVDPDPDPASAWEERERLFALPRSTWADYDTAKISAGGGIFPRSAKSVPLSPEIRERFGIEAESVPPNDLIRAILKAQVDLLWFGGIGTYVKAPEETAADVSDRANDPIRIDAADVGAKVIGEGANLGVTQQGRIAFALGGGRINTDAIDNSAGVDCSDHEVNIKILLGSVVAAGDMTGKQRDQVLEAMTDAVATLVLKDNYDQTQALTMTQDEGTAQIDAQMRLMRQLERGHLKLDREIEYLPSDRDLRNRVSSTGEGMSRPELAIILAYAKMALYDDLLASDLPDEARLEDDLERYFPEILINEHNGAIHSHPLRREIVATYVTNSMINRVGLTFSNRVRERTGDAAPEIARAYIVARDVFDIRALWAQVEALDNQVPASAQSKMLVHIKHLVQRATVWFLENAPRPIEMGSLVDDYTDGIAALTKELDAVIGEHHRAARDEKARGLVEVGVPQDLAERVAASDLLISGCDIVRLARQIEAPVTDVAAVYFQVGSRYSLDWLRMRSDAITTETHWQKLAIAAVVDDLFNHQITLAQEVIGAARGNGGMDDAEAAIDHWAGGRSDLSDRTARVLAEIRSQEQVDLAMLAVANGQFRALLAR